MTTTEVEEGAQVAEPSLSGLLEQAGFLEQLIGQTRPASSRQSKMSASAANGASQQAPTLNAFLSTESTSEQLRIWLGEAAVTRLANVRWSSIARQLQSAIARIDQLLSEQTSKIIHHPAFQKLEASWRGVEYLVTARADAGDEQIQLRILNASYAELCRDFDRAVEFDQSQLFQKVYEQEFGTAGGHPFGVLLADYDIHPRPSPDHPYDDMAMLRSFSQVAAAAFCPIVLNASPTMFGGN